MVEILVIVSSSKKQNQDSSEISLTTGKQKWSKKKKVEQPVELKFLTTIQGLVAESSTRDTEKDSIDLFCLTIASELKSFTEREQILAKHKIRSVMFEI